MYAGKIQFQSANSDAATMDSFYAEKEYEQSRHDTSFSMSRSMRSMTRHELGDRTNGCISPAAELDGKMRNPQRRRVPVAVCTSRSFEPLSLLHNHSVAGVEKERSSAVAIPVMVRVVQTAEVLATQTVNSCE